MKKSEEILENFTISYPIERLAPIEKMLFIDIETTGFTARSSALYMIGCAYYYMGNWHIMQWLAETYEEETALLSAFFEFAKSYKYLIHFNGNNFDLPFILQKCQMHSLPYTFDDFEGIDIYKRISTYKFMLKCPNLKQKTIEQFLDIHREDVFSGGELIGIYHDYVKNPSDFSEKSLFLHNADDLKGMLQILPILAYYDLFTQPCTVQKAQANSYKDFNGNTRKELILHLAAPVTLPKVIAANTNNCFLRGEGDEVTIKVPVIEEEMKYFYSNYHDYYYLPSEDVALHKSVATFVDKNYRVQATAATCYTRKYSSYLPEWDTVITPFFKRDYKSKELFFELTDELKRNRKAFTAYAEHLLAMFVTNF